MRLLYPITLKNNQNAAALSRMHASLPDGFAVTRSNLTHCMCHPANCIQLVDVRVKVRYLSCSFPR
jgi:hypothetical protein